MSVGTSITKSGNRERLSQCTGGGGRDEGSLPGQAQPLTAIEQMMTRDTCASKFETPLSRAG
jgi:hypothetical protein